MNAIAIRRLKNKVELLTNEISYRYDAWLEAYKLIGKIRTYLQNPPSDGNQAAAVILDMIDKYNIVDDAQFQLFNEDHKAIKRNHREMMRKVKTL